MTRRSAINACCGLISAFLLSSVCGFSAEVGVPPWRLPAMSPETKACVECHEANEARGYQPWMEEISMSYIYKDQAASAPICQQWGSSKHYQAHIGCYECHMAQEGERDAFQHEGVWIATIVSPKDCTRCHVQEGGEYNQSHHSKAARILGSLDTPLAEVTEGKGGTLTPKLRKGVSSAAVGGCRQCHGSEVKVLPGGKLDPATWPNSGIGRINPDGSEGSCTACHSRHTFSASQALHPDICRKCHMGPDHAEMEMCYESKRSNASRAFHRWGGDGDYHPPLVCATCHMSALPAQPATKDWAAQPGLPVRHDVGMRIWERCADRRRAEVRP